MEVEEKREGDILVVKVLNKRLDAQTANDFKEKMSGYVNNGSHLIVLNMYDVDFVDSSGLGAMVSVFKLLGGDGQLVICGTTEPVTRMFKLTRMNKVFSMFEGEAEAIKALSNYCGSIVSNLN